MRLDVLSENLKWLRLDRNLKMETVALETGIPTSTLSRLERLEYEPMDTSFKNIVTLADYYGVSIDYLPGREHSEEVAKTEISELGLMDRAIEKLKADKRHGQVLSALITLNSFEELLNRIEILVDRSMETTYANFNQYYEALLLHVRKVAGKEIVEDEVTNILEHCHFNDEFDRYKIKAYIDTVLDELLDKYGNKVMEDKSVNSPMNKILSAVVQSANLAVKGKKPSLKDIMSVMVGSTMGEKQGWFQKLVGGVDTAVAKQNFSLKRNRKFDGEQVTQ